MPPTISGAPVAGGKHHRFKRGYKNVIDEGIRLNSVGQETHLAIETSGHGALKENNWLDDGAYAMVKLLIKMAAAATAGEGRGSGVLTKLIEELQEAEVATELRFKIDQAHPDVEGCVLALSRVWSRVALIRFDRSSCLKSEFRRI